MKKLLIRLTVVTKNGSNFSSEHLLLRINPLDNPCINQTTMVNNKTIGHRILYLVFS